MIFNLKKFESALSQLRSLTEHSTGEECPSLPLPFSNSKGLK